MHKQIYALLTAILLLVAGTQRAGAQFNPTNPGDPPGGGTTGGGGTTVTSYYFAVKANPAGACTNIYPASGNRTFGTQLNPYFSGVNQGYKFVNWTNSAGEVVSVIGDFYYYMPEHDETLTANFEYTYDPTNPGDPTGGTTGGGGGGGTTQTSYFFSVKANPAGACTSIYPSSGNRTVGSQINPYFSGVNQGYKFVNWTNLAGEVVSSIGDFYYYMPSHDETLTANFDYTFSPTNPGDPTGGTTGGGGTGGGSSAATYNLTVKTNPAGVCTNLYPASGSREEGSRVNPYYTGLNSNYRFVNWTNSAGEVISTVSDFYYYMPSHDETITANFEFYPVNPGDPAGGTVENPLGTDKVFGPRFSLDANNVVTIFCQTPAATIYYTTDGSEPTTASTLYTEPFAIESNTMVRAMATKEGMKASQITFYQIMPQRCEPPKIEFISGRRLKMSCPTPNAVIYYTTDLTTPDAAEGVGIKYDGTPITLSDNRRIMAVAIAPGFGQSEVLEYSHRTVEHQTATPVIKFDETTNNATITCETPDASIHYTLDGSQPTEGTEPNKSGVTIKIAQNCTIKAMAVSTDLYESFVSEYVVKLGTVRTPVVTFDNRAFAIATESKNATIYYTLDGSTPSKENGTKYSAPFLPASDCRIKAVACVEGYDDSDVAEFQYRRVNHTVATPRFSRANDKLTLTCANAESQIYWIEGDKAPIGEDFKPVAGAQLYTEPISLSKNCVITARAMKENMLLSESVSFDVTGFVATLPVITFENRKVVISNGMTGHSGVIRYTIDGTVPTDSVGAVYSKPFLPTADCTVKAVFFTDSFNPSAVTEYVYRKAEHTVAKPQFSRKGNKIAITSATQGAQIFWGKGAEIAKAMPIVNEYETAVKTGADFDYEAAKATLATVAHVYTDSVDVLSNEKYAAIALAENMLIDYNTYEVSDMVAVQPVISFENRKVVISNGMTGHSGMIRYTIDGTVPTDSASVYSKPFLPTADCTVKAVFFTDSFNPSAVTEYVYRKAEHTVAKPQFSRKDNKIAITSATQGAQIFWGKGAEIAKAMPIVTEYETAVKTGADFDYEAAKATLATVAHVYTDSVDVLSNEKYAAIALAENMLIDYATYEVSDMVAVQPVISFANRKVVISNGMTGHSGVIRYTIDGAVPSDTASVYSKPFLPTADCTVKAVFFTESFNPSAVTEYVYRKAEHTVAKPQFSRNGNKIAITSATQGAQIFWGKGAEIAKAMPIVNEYETAVKTGADFDYETAKATLATVAHVYTDSVDVISNEKYAAIALAENMLIDYNTYEVSDMVAVQPVITFENRKVVISNGMTGHSGVIRYTIDGTVPTDSVGAVYSKPFLPTQDCTVKAVFFTDSFNPSAVTEYVYRKAEHTVDKPQFSRNGNKIAITSATQGAQIFWGKGAEIAKAMPIVTEYETALKTGADFDYAGAIVKLDSVAHVYTDSIALVENSMFAAIALADNMLIDYATFEVTDFTCPGVEIGFARKAVWIKPTSAEEGAKIMFKLYSATDSAQVIQAAREYTEPFLPATDCVVEAWMRKSNFNDSDSTRYAFVGAEHTLPVMSFAADFKAGTAVLSAPEGETVGIGEAVSLKVNGIEVVSVGEGENVGQREVNLSRVLADQGALAGSVEATWISIDRLENNPLLININKAKTPIVSYDGRVLSVNSPKTNVIYSIAKDKGGADEGETAVENSLILPLSDTGSMTCKAWGDSLLLSDEASIEIAAFHDGERTATVRKAGALKEAFGWLQGETLSVEELTVTGPGRVEDINSEDLATIGGFTNLRSLNLENTAADASAGVFNTGGFAGLVEISLPRSGANGWNLAENAQLCAVHWNDSTKMSSVLANPNAVVFARESGLVAEGLNCVVGGASQRFTLTDGYPFYTPESFTAASASYVKRFSKTTTPGESRGWETIVLPFGVEKVTHLDKGREIAAFGDNDAAKKEMRRFWLAEVGNGGFKSASRIVANQPYLIAMPNSKEYLDDWNISGEIEFAATNATVSSELPAKVAFGSDTREFTGTYFPLAASASRYALVAETDGDCFAAERSAIKPMECYFEGQAGMMRIPIGSGESYIPPITTDTDEIRVFTEGERVVIISPRDARIGVYNIAGMLVRLVDINANEPATVDALEHGIYIIANKKIIF